MRVIVLMWLLMFTNFGLIGQGIFLSGTVRDSASLEPLVGAGIQELLSSRAVVTDENGYFVLYFSSAIKSVNLQFSYVGYEKKIVKTELNQIRHLDIKLSCWRGLPEVTINASQATSSPNGLRLKEKLINALPQLAGENDFLRTLQSFPGILPSDESKNTLYVRGGSPDQNLILIEGIPTFYIYHLGSLSSTFNPDIISDISFSNGGFDARYGDRLSSFIDVTMKEGNKKKLAGEGQIGLLTSRMNIQGPLIQNRGSFIFSARAFYSPILQLFKSPIKYGFQDYFGKICYEFSDKSSVAAIILHTYDLLKTNLLSAEEKDKKDNTVQTGWANEMIALRWNYRFSTSADLRTQVYYSGYQCNLGFKVNQYVAAYEMNSKNMASATGLSVDFTSIGRLKTTIGCQLKQYKFSTGEGFFKSNINGVYLMDTIFSGFTEKPVEGSLYFNQETHFSKHWTGNWGIRTNYFKNDNSFISIEPRLNLAYRINNLAWINLSYSRITQPMHLVSLSYSEMPNDFWIAGHKNFPPEIANQVAAGIKMEFSAINSFSLNLYHKRFSNLLWTNQAIPIILGNVIKQEGQFFKGNGRSDGIELLWNYNGNAVTGWISATFSKTTRLFTEVNGGESFPFGNDRPIYLTTCWIYNLSETLNFSAQWFFASGKPITLPEQKYSLEGTQLILFDYSNINAYRMKPIHRLDVGLNYLVEHRWGTSTWNFSIINAYNQQNPFFYTITVEKVPNTSTYKLVTRQNSFFFFLPSVSYKVAFN